MSRMITSEELRGASMREFYDLYRRFDGEYRNAAPGSERARIARANLEAVITAIRVRQYSGPKPRF